GREVFRLHVGQPVGLSVDPDGRDNVEPVGVRVAQLHQERLDLRVRQGGRRRRSAGLRKGDQIGTELRRHRSFDSLARRTIAAAEVLRDEKQNSGGHGR
ncbi:hypothetical protein CPZ06_10270, partial [Lactobacillus acidophilus]